MVYSWVVVLTALVGVATVHARTALTARDLDRPDRIVGGEPVKRGEMPWQVSLQQRGSHFCGATLIGQHWVITAAHCTRNINYKHVRAIVGGWDLNEQNTEYKIKKVIVGDYSSSTMTNDIALLRLQPNPHKRSRGKAGEQKPIPIALDNRSEVANEECIVSGWGRESENGQLPDILRATAVTLRTDEECQKMVYTASSYKIFNTNLCAGGGERDACQGDSGGPLVCCRKTARDVSSCRLSGITSWGIGCATRGVPGIYTEVGHYIDWIHEHIKEEDGDLRLLVPFVEEDIEDNGDIQQNIIGQSVSKFVKWWSQMFGRRNGHAKGHKGHGDRKSRRN